METNWELEFEIQFGDEFNKVPGNMPIIATGTSLIELTRFISNLLASERTRLATAVEGLMQDEHPTENGVPVETYGYEAAHNAALKAAADLIRHSPNK